MAQTPSWDLFAAFLVVAVVFLLVTARASHRWLFGETESEHRSIDQGTELESNEFVHPSASDSPKPTADPDDAVSGPASSSTPAEQISTEALLLNVALSQALLGGAIAVAVWLTGVPLATFGIRGTLSATLLTGVAFGIALYALTEIGSAATGRLGYESDERLRKFLSPDDARGWAVLLTVVLPSIAVVEELLFRGAMIGALSVGLGLSPWTLAVVSSALFGVGHGAQGRGGILVTGVLGLLIAAGFIVTGSLLVVIVAHYCVNALEFIVHEGLGLDWIADRTT